MAPNFNIFERFKIKRSPKWWMSIRNLTRSLRSLVRFLIRQQLVRKYRTPALSMKYSLFISPVKLIWISWKSSIYVRNLWLWVRFLIGTKKQLASSVRSWKKSYQVQSVKFSFAAVIRRLKQLRQLQQRERQKPIDFITGGPDVVCVNILIFTWTKWDESSKLPWTKIVQKSKYNKTKLRHL